MYSILIIQVIAIYFQLSTLTTYENMFGYSMHIYRKQIELKTRC